MTNPPFQWNPDENQTYTESDGSQQLTGVFNKTCGKSFTMQALNQQLSLLVSSNGTNVWGGTCNSWTSIALDKGTLTFGAPAPETAYGRLSLVGTDITLQQAARFNANLWVYDSSAFLHPNQMNLKPGSAVEIYCAESYAAAGFINIDSARMEVKSPVIKVESCKVSLSSDAMSPGASVFMECIPQTVQSDFPLVRMTDATIQCANASTMQIRMQTAQPLVFLDSTVSVRDSAAVEIYADNLAFPAADPTRFEIAGPGACTIKFYGATPGTQALDFIKNIYSPGLFRFARKTVPENRGSLLIAKCGNAFQYANMLKQQLLYVDDQAADASMFNQLYEPNGDLIIMLK